MFEYHSGGASSSGDKMFWIEEGLLSDNAAVKRRGNLYMLAEGPQAESEAALKAIRDQYCGDPSQPQGGNSAALRQSMEAANSLLGKRTGIGASCACAVASEWGQLSLFRAGDCHAFLFTGQDGEIYRLGDKQTADTALGRAAELPLGEVRRVLRNRDVLILCSGAVADCLPTEEIASIASLHPSTEPEELAKRLVEKASLAGTGGILTVVVVICEGLDAGISPTLPLRLDAESRWGSGEDDDAPTGRTFPKLPRLGLGTAKLGGLNHVPAIAVGAVVLVTVLILSRSLLPGFSTGPSAPEPSATAQPTVDSDQSAEQSSPATTPTTALPIDESPETVMARVDAMWKEAKWQDMANLQRDPTLLEQAQSRTPQDSKLKEALGKARTNLAFARSMQEIGAIWGKGETSATTTSNWARIVEILETFKATSPTLPYPLSSQQSKAAKEKLYVAHSSYGKALDAAKRPSEAKGQRDRAEEIRSKDW